MTILCPYVEDEILSELRRTLGGKHYQVTPGPNTGEGYAGCRESGSFGREPPGRRAHDIIHDSSKEQHVAVLHHRSSLLGIFGAH